MERGAVVSFPGWLKKLGDSSYSLYLVHPLVVAALYKVADLSGTITRISS